MSDISKLQAVSTAVMRAEEALSNFRLEADARVDEQMKSYVKDIESAVLRALDDEFSVTDVARAYTISGKTPNRNVIHAIKRRYESEEDTLTVYPFEWVARTTTTARGDKTVYDIHAVLEEFGPDDVTGEYTWRYDRATGEPEQVLTEHDPYPASKYYTQALTRWIMVNAYPGEDE